MESKGEININLLNFEDPQFEDSKYILTSPRSLEACSRLNIKVCYDLTVCSVWFLSNLVTHCFMCHCGGSVVGLVPCVQKVASSNPT